MSLSYRGCSYRKGDFPKFAVEYFDARVITGFSVGGRDCMAMVGPDYFNAVFPDALILSLRHNKNSGIKTSK